MDNDVLLEIKDLEVIYQTDMETVKAVNGISFTLYKRETLGLVGETGAGKTTTALSIMRLLPDRVGQIKNGQIIFNGMNLLELPEEEMEKVRGEKISMIFQDPMTSLNPTIIVGNQISESLELHNAKNRSKAAIAARVDEILKLVGIHPERKSEYPHQFSGGMKQRVIIAMALACDPELLIADEPTTALDVTIQAQVLAMMEDLKSKLGTSMIMITHDLGIVANNCDKVGIIYAGEIIEYGMVEDIYEGEDHHPYTAGLFGSIPDLEKDSARLTPIDGLMPDPTKLPEGCKFHPRCPRCMDRCRTSVPPEIIRGTHRIKCFLFGGEG